MANSYCHTTDSTPDISRPGNDKPANDGRWSIQPQLVLRSGDHNFQGDVETLDYEPHLGDVMAHGGWRVEQALRSARDEGVLRFVPVAGGIVFVPVDNVSHIRLDVLDPDGVEVDAVNLKPGSYRTDLPVDYAPGS